MSKNMEEYLMNQMLHNRIVITFDKEIVILEKSSEIDKNITQT